MSAGGVRARTYGGWQYERVSFLFGFSGRRAALLGAGVFCGLQPVASGRLAAAWVCWPLAAVFALVASVRVVGRTLDEWVITVVSFQWLRLRGRTSFRSGPFAPGHGLGPDGLDLPGILAPLMVLTAEAGTPREVAVLHHPYQHTYAAVAALSYPGLGLHDAARQDEQVDAWGSVISSLCGQDHPIARVQVVHRTVPEPGVSLRSWHVEHLDPAAPLASVMATEQLLAASTLTCRRDTWLVISLDARRAALAIRAAGGGQRGACAVLERHVTALTPILAGAGLHVDRWLAERDLAQVLRTGFDPTALGGLEERRPQAAVGDAATMPRPGLPASLAGPAAAESSWSSYRHDGAISVTYAVHAWPLAPVYATCLSALLADSPHRRTLSLLIEPLGPREARRAVLVERTKREAGVRLRARTGQAVSAIERVQLDRAEAQDAEHAAGRGLARFTAYLTVTVTDATQLDEACAQAEAAAAHAGIELRRMYGAHDIGFALTLPVGLGLPSTRW
jgi:hypothetical protein